MERSRDIYENFKFVKVAGKKYRDFVSKVKHGRDLSSKSGYDGGHGQLNEVVESYLGSKIP